MSSLSKTNKTKPKRSIAGITFAPASSSAPNVKVLPLANLQKKAKTGSLSLPNLALEELKNSVKFDSTTRQRRRWISIGAKDKENCPGFVSCMCW